MRRLRESSCGFALSVCRRDRAVVRGEQHQHGFVRRAPHYYLATAKHTRGRRVSIISSLRGFTVLKTTQVCESLSRVRALAL